MEKEIYGFKFNITEISDEDNVDNQRSFNVHPNPDAFAAYIKASEVFSQETLSFLWSKFYFGVRHRTSMFNVLYNTYIDTLSAEDNIDRILTLQALSCDMIIRFGMSLEELAALCFSLEKYRTEDTEIIDSYLAFRDPASFYSSITSRRGMRRIKRIFKLPENKLEYNNVFSNLTEEELDLLWKANNITTQNIQNKIKLIAQTITRRETHSFTYYDMYNKLKHAFAPIYHFTIPEPLKLAGVSTEENIEDVLKQFVFDHVTIMHDKLPGQRTTEERIRFETENLATPTMTTMTMDINTMQTLKHIMEEMEKLYNHLIGTYLSHSEGRSPVTFMLDNDSITEEEAQQIKAILDDPHRVISN
ncbi:hypothetical protein [Bacillus thuringiensis]|uniref:hypothetical protein n=1 Tax=Bacillus cereus group TaxID=86661 RepID=UPI000BF91D71|nr:hypothetical protein [Bacillus thuringiensis]PEW28497.1 hypothetical protein CN427_11745 [Bacillus thuringiensis]